MLMEAKKLHRIINVGRFPPPVGGVSYFLKRLKQHMESVDAFGEESTFIDISNIDTREKETQGVRCMSLYKTFFWMLGAKPSLIVFHSNRMPVLIGAYLLSFRHKIAIFAHGESILRNVCRKKRFLLGRITALVAPTDQIAENIRRTYPEYATKVFQIPFVLFPPDIGVIDQPDIRRIRSSHKIMLSAYAYDIKQMDGVDLYGVDMLIDLMGALRNGGYDAGMVLVLPACSETSYARETLSKIHSENLEDVLFVYRKRLDEAIDLFALSDIYIRPSSTDGDSFAIWEALYAGTPVVASDVVARPKGCRLFKHRDRDDLLHVTQNVIDAYKENKDSVLSLNIQGSEKKLFAFFHEMTRCEYKS